MKVLFLGAGASRAAGYPLASDLLDDVAAHVEGSYSEQNHRDWQLVENFSAGLTGALKRTFESPNPEIRLSLLDLLVEACATERSTWFKAVLTGQEYEEGSDGTWQDQALELTEAENVRKALLRCLDHFFWCCHVRDWKSDGRSAWRYLQQELQDIEPDDIVITTNWDTLIERVLLEANLWSPVDGYGVATPLRTPPGPRRDLPPELQRSPTKILKLHGSFGWYQGLAGELCLKSELLERLPLPVRVRDLSGASEAGRPLLVTYPTFLKRFDRGPLYGIWRAASHALSRAAAFRAIGYSLPPSDGAIRALLLPLCDRHAQSEVDILVKDPDANTLRRWQDLLGDRIKTAQEASGGNGRSPKSEG